jgi:hypothetical protein
MSEVLRRIQRERMISLSAWSGDVLIREGKPSARKAL